jgi:hypothetical protein
MGGMGLGSLGIVEKLLMLAGLSMFPAIYTVNSNGCVCMVGFREVDGKCARSSVDRCVRVVRSPTCRADAGRRTLACDLCVDLS